MFVHMRPAAIAPGHPGAAFAPPSSNGQVAPGMDNASAAAPAAAAAAAAPSGAFGLHQPRPAHPPGLVPGSGVVGGGMQPGMVPHPAGANVAGVAGGATPDQASVAAALAAAQQFFGFMQQGGAPGGFPGAPHGAFGAPIAPDAGLHRPSSAAALHQDGLGAGTAHVHQLSHPHAHLGGGDVTMGGTTQSRGPTPGLHAPDISAAAYNRKDKR